MQIVESNHVREIMLFRIKSLNAIGMHEYAAMVRDDLAAIMQHEKTIVMSEVKNEQVERMWRVKNAN